MYTRITFLLIIVVLAAAAPFEARGSVPSGVVAWWPAENDANEVVNNLNGTLVNGVGFAPGLAGQAFVFDGINDYVNVPDHPTLDISETITIEFWARRQRLDNTTDIILEKGGDWTNGQANYGVGLHGGSSEADRYFYFWCGGSIRATAGGRDLAWHHYAVVATSGDANPLLYIDGVARPVEGSSGPAQMTLVTNTEPLHIGAQLAYSYYSNAVIDELRIYSRALTPEEIQAIYHYAILYVDAGATGTGDGTSWADAYPRLQDAMVVAKSGAEIRVAQGAYKPDQGGGKAPGDRTASFQLVHGVNVQGGYAGSANPANPDERDIDTYPTILSGDLNGDDQPGFINYGDNSYHVVNGSGTDGTAILEGFTIRGGNAVWPPGDDYGGGLAIHNWPLTLEGPTIRQCTFTANKATGHSGGVNSFMSNVKLTDCTFTGNFGGVNHSYGTGGGAVLTNCKFVANTCAINNHGDMTLSGCLFQGNSATRGAAIYFTGGTTTVRDCDFLDNGASDCGGAILVEQGGCAISLTNCLFTGNGVGNLGGAGIFINQNLSPGPWVTLTNCAFTCNQAPYGVGAGLYYGSGTVTLINCTFSRNSAPSWNEGAGIYAGVGVAPTLVNCVLWANVDAGGTDESAQIFAVRERPVITYSFIQGCSEFCADPNNHNISGDPWFVDPDGPDDVLCNADDDLRLLRGSPCIDAGDNALVTEGWDLAGSPRRMDDPLTEPDSGAGTKPVVDMGAYEYVCVNQAPVVHAGPDQTVNEGDFVTLDGSASLDPDNDALSYAWTQLGGPDVSLDLTDPAHPTFKAPTIPIGGATLTLQLIVSDGQLPSEPDVVNIAVVNVNHAPVAIADGPAAVVEAGTAVLDGSRSYDPDDDPLSYTWSQTAGPVVELDSTDPLRPQFTAPLVGPAGETLSFQLTVSDTIDCGTDTVVVLIENVNHDPAANAGSDQTASEGSLVTLDGTASSDADNDPLSYAWTQLAGPPVTLSDPLNGVTSFVAPLVPPGGEVLVFELIVNDGYGGVASDSVTITVQNIYDPPACELAQPSIAELWPPNHKLIPVTIMGVTDQNNDAVIITITDVTQDEPVNGLGDGDTSPDAVIQGSSVLLRAERSGTGNGRVYRVTFQADDGFAGTCRGEVTICVPHSKGKNALPCVDDGQNYNSLTP